MGATNRITTLLRTNLDALISRAEDPQRLLDQVVFEMKSQLIEAKKQVAVAIAQERRLHKTAQAYQDEATAWERRAMLAVRAGDDDLARAALGRKGELDELARVYGQQWQAHRHSVETLRSALRALSDKIAHTQRESRVLVARAMRARAQLTIAATLSNLDTASPTGTLQRMEDRVVQLEAEADAMAELGPAFHGSLEAQFAALEANAQIEDQLAALKRKALRETKRPHALPPSPPAIDFD